MRNFQSVDQMTLNDKQEIIDFEQELMRQEQVEVSALMPPLSDITELWLHTIRQVGFVAFFSLSFTIGPLWVFVVEVFSIHLSFFVMSSAVKRPIADEKNNIGVWEQVLFIYTMIGLIINAFIVAFSCKGVYELIGWDSESKENQYKLLVILIIVENSVFVLKFIVDAIIPDMPGWIKKKMKGRKDRKKVVQDRMYESKIANNPESRSLGPHLNKRRTKTSLSRRDMDTLKRQSLLEGDSPINKLKSGKIEVKEIKGENKEFIKIE